MKALFAATLLVAFSSFCLGQAPTGRSPLLPTTEDIATLERFKLLKPSAPFNPAIQRQILDSLRNRNGLKLLMAPQVAVQMPVFVPAPNASAGKMPVIEVTGNWQYNMPIAGGNTGRKVTIAEK